MTLNRNLKLLMVLSLVCVILIGIGGFRIRAMFHPSQPDILNGRLQLQPEIPNDQLQSQPENSNDQLQWIEITGRDLWDKGRWRLFKKSPSDLVKFEMGLDSPYENVSIRLKPKPGDGRELKVEQQIETSMMLNDEGLPLYLLNWKHGLSSWVELSVIKLDSFRGVPITEKDSDRFPAYTRQEFNQAIINQERINASIYKGLYYQNEERWLGVARQKPQDGNIPYGPSVSTIRLRVKAKEGDTWQVIHTVEILVAFGC